jgi:hypothetical protein
VGCLDQCVREYTHLDALTDDASSSEVHDSSRSFSGTLGQLFQRNFQRRRGLADLSTSMR